MNSLHYLLNMRPNWVQINQNNQTELKVVARGPKDSGLPGRSYRLVIRSLSGHRISVAEDPESAILPNCCVERHINPDSTFCLFLDSTNPIRSNEEAETWWSGLKVYLNHQDYAQKHRRWPLRAQLCHGDAAEVQTQMESLVGDLGWQDELAFAMFRSTGWLSGNLPRPTKSGSGLVNVRSPCPRGCTHKHLHLRKHSCVRDKCVLGCARQHQKITRSNCPNRRVVEQLVILEFRRRSLEAGFIAELIKAGVECCGTMDDCALAI